MATRGALGGLAEAALQAALLMDAAGKDDVFLETVGVGQAEVDVIDHADSVVLVLIPGSGDSIQALKAGVMEIPDVIVVNKADHPLTDTMVREIRGVLSLAPQGGWPVPIVKTEAHRGEGVERARREARRAPRVRRVGGAARPSAAAATCMNEVLGLATVRLRRALEASLREDAEVQELLDEVVARRLDPASAASAILARGAVDASARRTVGAARPRLSSGGAAACDGDFRALAARQLARRRRRRAASSPTPTERQHGASTPGCTHPSAPPNASATTQPRRARQRQRAEHGARARRVAQPPGAERRRDGSAGTGAGAGNHVAVQRRRAERRDQRRARRTRQRAGPPRPRRRRCSATSAREVLAARAPQQPGREDASASTGAQRSSPTSRSIHSAARRGTRSR